MAFFELTPSTKGFAYSLDTQKAFRAPIGAASPLWLAFAGATGAGLAFWWMSRLMRPVNLEAFLFRAAETPAPQPQLVLAPPEPIIEEPVIEEPVIEAAPEPVFAAVAEPVPIEPPAPTIAEVMADEPAPVMEAAPEPVIEAAPKITPAPPVEPEPEPMRAVAAKPAVAAEKPSKNSAAKSAPKKRG